MRLPGCGARSAAVLRAVTAGLVVAAAGTASAAFSLDRSGRFAIQWWSVDDGLPEAPVNGVAFDAEHLRRVLVNLLDNALRHGSSQRHAIVVRLAPRDDEEAVIVVASDGEPIAPDVERHLFEPFFSTRSRGSGLGLYICRELCERYGASIEYRARARNDQHRNSFVVLMRRRALGGIADTLDRAGQPAIPAPPREPAPNDDA